MSIGDWFDGHLDLTYIALHGRDLTRDIATCGGTLQPASVTFPALRQAHVSRAFSTLFVRRQTAEVTGDYCFNTPEEAYAAALRQVAMHDAWSQAGSIQLETKNAPLENQQSQIENRKSKIENHAPLRVTLAMEGAAPIRHLDDAAIFHDLGVRMVSLAWAEGTQWAGGDQSGAGGGDDITPEGRQLVARLDELGVIHDVSHLSERAFWTLLEIARGPVVASHSNCRALLPGGRHPERHLSDGQLRALASRPGSRVGINMFARFIIPPDELARRRATLADVLRHLAHIEQITGRRDLLALGSDFDSGFGGDLLPADLQGPQHLHRLAEALSAAGWTDAQIARFAGNWEF